MSKSGVWRWSFVSAMVMLTAAVLHVGSQVATASRAVPTPVPVATVDLPALLELLDERPVREAELQALFEKHQGELQQLVARVEAAEADMDVAAPSQQEDFMMKYLQAANDAKFKKELNDRIMARKQRQFQLSLFNKIKAASARYAEAEGFAIVICDDSDREIPEGLADAALQAAILGQRLMYVNNAAIDITDAVAAQMNADFARTGP